MAVTSCVYETGCDPNDSYRSGTLHDVGRRVVLFIMAVSLTWPAHRVGGNLDYHYHNPSCHLTSPQRCGALSATGRGVEHGWTRVWRMHADRSSPRVLPSITTATRRMSIPDGRDVVRLRNGLRPKRFIPVRYAARCGAQGRAVHHGSQPHVACSQGRWQPGLSYHQH